MPEPVKVLFVCMGNICRSPTAHAVFQQRVRDAGLADRVTVDSCGTGGWHVGNPPDPRATAAGAKRGYDLSGLRARQLTAEDMDRFDYVLVMDRDNYQHAERLTTHARTRPELFLAYAPQSPVQEVPDPYYGAGDGFEQVLDLIEAASDGLLADIRERWF